MACAHEFKVMIGYLECVRCGLQTTWQTMRAQMEAGSEVQTGTGEFPMPRDDHTKQALEWLQQLLPGSHPRASVVTSLAKLLAAAERRGLERAIEAIKVVNSTHEAEAWSQEFARRIRRLIEETKP